jgi:EAL domain-containing protein (putative c-di-GMP-specific phosphodiesterase class I)
MIAPDLKKVIPFFQPIIRAADRSVFAYEVLAREERDGRIHSLGPYFEDPAVPDLDKLRLDLHVRKRAFEAYAASGSKAKLFINLKPSWVCMNRKHHKKLPTLAMLDQYAIDPQHLVIEVTEEELTGDYEVFGKQLTEYRKAGCMLAIDDFGKGASNVERIAHVMPDIIKLDRSIVQKTDTHRSFYEICSAMSAFGAVSGFNLLFEGVETASQLERCVKTGWCYLQGFIFSQAKPEFETEYDNEDLLSDILSLQSSQERWHIRRRHDVCTTMESEIERLRPLIPLDEETLRESPALHDLAKELPYYCVRCLVCNDKGKVLSRAYQLEGYGVVTVMEDGPSIGNFWGLFAQGLYALHGDGRGYLSDIYKNVTNKENVVTYMHKLRQDRLLCVEIMPMALY